MDYINKVAVCGHTTREADCVKCLAHTHDLLRHAEAMLRKHLANRPTRVTISINKIRGKQ